MSNEKDIGFILNDAELNNDTSYLGYSENSPRLNYDELKLKSGIDRYELVDLIDSGGLGKVYKAFDSKLGKEVAIKVLSDDASMDFNTIEAEAKVIGRLHHPNIVEVYNFIQQEDPNGVFGEEGAKVSFMIMEYLSPEKGCRDSLKLCNSFDLPLIQKTITEIASAIDYLNEQGILYQDIKPQNIMLTPNGAKLIDFGSATKVIELNTSKYGESELEFVKTPMYSSPERLRTNTQDLRGEVYSLALTAYKYIFARSRYVFAGRYDIEYKPDDTKLEKLQEKGVDISKLMQVFDKALQLKPEDRYSTATEFAKALKEVLDVEKKDENQ